MKAPITLYEKYLYHFYWIIEHWFGSREDRLGHFGKKRNELSKKIIARMPSDGNLNVRPIVVLDSNTDPEFIIKNYIIPRVPFVIKGFCRDWPAVKNWSPDFFAENYGDLVEPFVNPGVLDTEYNEYTIREIVEQIKNGSLKYLKLSNIIHRVPSLSRDLMPEVFNIYKNKFGAESSRQFFMGAVGTKSLFHCALSNVYFVQIHGKKRWFLIHESFTPMLNPLIDRQPYFLAEVDHSDPTLPETKEFFSKIPMIEVNLEAGDFYFNPGFTWHYVENLSTSIGIGFRRNSLRTPYQNFLSTLIIMTANYPSSFLQIFRNKKGIFFPKRWP